MDKLFQVQKDYLRNNAIARTENRLGLAIKCVLFSTILLVALLLRPSSFKSPLSYAYIGVFAFGTIFYIYLYRRFLYNHRAAIMVFGSCLEVLCIALIYCTLFKEQLVLIAFVFFSLPILRLILFYPSVSEFLVAAGLSSAVFLSVIATLSIHQLALAWFWAHFVSTWLLFSLGAAITSKLYTKFVQSIKNWHLILQTLQMTGSLVEMAKSAAYLRKESKIFQRAVEIIFRIMAVQSCVAWIYQDGKLRPAASEGLDKKQISEFQQMLLPTSDISIFDRALTQKEPIVITGDDLAGALPLSYRQCFGVMTMLVIPLMDKKRILGCIAMHWSIVPEKLTSQELAVLCGLATQVGITLENVYLLEELREKEEIRGRLLERVISIQEEERERIARELHDETGQILTALMMNVEILRTEPEFQSAKFQEQLEEISLLLSKTMEDIHSLSLALHPKMLNELGLIPAIRWYAKNHLGRWEIDFDIVANNLNRNLSPRQEICLFRIAQEAITNVIRHAKAQRVDIEIDIDMENVYLNVKDNGKGFDIAPFGESCLGLIGMKERVNFLGGQIDIRSKIDEGTEISVNIPLRQSVDRR